MTKDKSEMRILMTAWLQASGGIETHLLTLTRLLVAKGATVTIGGRVLNDEVPLVRLAREIPAKILSTPFRGNKRLLRLSTAFALMAWPRSIAAPLDMIYTYELSGFIRAFRRYLKPGGLIVGSWAGELPGPQLAPRIIGNVDAMMVESEMHRLAFVEFLGPNFPIHVAPILGHYANPPARSAGVPDVLRIGFLGRLVKAKGIYRLLEVWPRLPIASAQLHYYGRGEEAARLREISRTPAMAGRVFVHEGWDSPKEFAAIADKIDMMVLPSETEGLPLVLLEAMAFGIPFVATDVGAVRSLAINNPDVSIVPPNDDARLCDAIANLGKGLREGSVSPVRLQEFHRRNYSFERIGKIWLESLTNPSSWD